MLGLGAAVVGEGCTRNYPKGESMVLEHGAATETRREQIWGVEVFPLRGPLSGVASISKLEIQLGRVSPPSSVSVSLGAPPPSPCVWVDQGYKFEPGMSKTFKSLLCAPPFPYYFQPHFRSQAVGSTVMFWHCALINLPPLGCLCQVFCYRDEIQTFTFFKKMILLSFFPLSNSWQV